MASRAPGLPRRSPSPRPRSRRLARTAALRAEALARDLANRRRYGSRAPRAFQRIWVDPLACRRRILGFDGQRSGAVVGGDWDLDNPPLDEYPKMALLRLHWEDGVPWEDTGLFEHLLERIERKGRPLYGCRTRSELVRRYQQLDVLFEQVRHDGRLRTRAEVEPGAVREHGGILVHVARDGEPIFAKEGCHRLAMARALRLPRVPAQLGVVHTGALDRWQDLYAHEEAPTRVGLPRQP